MGLIKGERPSHTVSVSVSINNFQYAWLEIRYSTTLIIFIVSNKQERYLIKIEGIKSLA